jgi:MerR family transcriptional regulator/heat shock protein HspR
VPTHIDPDTPVYSIGSAARILGISVHTLRMYEREGLILPFKTETHQRRYSSSDIERVRCIRTAINEQGFNIAGIRSVQALLPCWELKNCTDQERSVCPAYEGHAGGCWTYAHAGNACASNDCRVCEVYQASTDCSRIKKFIAARF